MTPEQKQRCECCVSLGFKPCKASFLVWSDQRDRLPVCRLCRNRIRRRTPSHIYRETEINRD